MVCDEGAGSPIGGTRHPSFGVAISGDEQPTGDAVASAAPSAPVRLLLGTCVAFSLAVSLLVAGRADGAGREWTAYLAPAGTCAGETSTRATRLEKARTIRCLVNWARAREGRGVLAAQPSLTQAAAMKGKAVAACGQLSHTPCGSDLSAQVRATGYRFAVFGENLYLGPWGQVSAREVVAAWLRSPSHRANLLSPGYRHLGVAPARAPGLLDAGQAVLWTAAFAAPS